MPHLLKNKCVEVHIDLPLENYQSSRFDWTGKISQVFFKGIPLTGLETHLPSEGQDYGQGFYNEFGMDSLPGFEETEIGGWCHKIGIGLVRKETETYHFQQDYQIRPALFEVQSRPNSILILCRARLENGYGYFLEKEIELLESGFEIRYHLLNTGTIPIHTTEYVHNFLSIDSGRIGVDDSLSFPFPLVPEAFGETVNPDKALSIENQGVSILHSPDQQFFFSDLSGGEPVPAKWKFHNKKHNIVISETADFTARKINLWGWQRVISPELFVEIDLKAGEEKRWWRRFDFSTATPRID